MYNTLTALINLIKITNLKVRQDITSTLATSCKVGIIITYNKKKTKN